MVEIGNYGLKVAQTCDIQRKFGSMPNEMNMEL
jgi:hypothetical protein